MDSLVAVMRGLRKASSDGHHENVWSIRYAPLDYVVVAGGDLAAWSSWMR